MKIGVISDLHIDVNHNTVPLGKTFTTILSDKLQREEIDLLLIPGDISNDYRLSLQFLKDLERINKIKVLFVPGNHDYWSKDNGNTDTWEVYQVFKQWKGCICEQPYELNDDWVVVGNSGWYDHTFGSLQFSEAEFKQMNYDGRTWQDSIYTDWDMENKDVHRFFYETIEKDLEKYRDKKIIMMTHMITHPSFIVPMPNKLWAYFNAFLGSKFYQHLYERYNVVYGIMGHVHFRKEDTTEKTKMICACLGNHNEWKTNQVRKEIDDAFYTFTI